MDIATLLALGVLSPGELNAYINNLPRQPTRIAEMGLFKEAGLNGTTFVKVGIKNDQLVLVPNKPRGAPGQVKSLNRGRVKIFETAHLPQNSTVMADELLNVFRPDDPAGESSAADPNHHAHRTAPGPARHCYPATPPRPRRPARHDEISSSQKARSHGMNPNPL